MPFEHVRLRADSEYLAQERFCRLLNDKYPRATVVHLTVTKTGAEEYTLSSIIKYENVWEEPE